MNYKGYSSIGKNDLLTIPVLWFLRSFISKIIIFNMISDIKWGLNFGSFHTFNTEQIWEEI